MEWWRIVLTCDWCRDEINVNEGYVEEACIDDLDDKAIFRRLHRSSNIDKGCGILCDVCYEQIKMDIFDE